MKSISKSSFIFDLIDEFQIFTLNGEANVLTNENLVSFCDKYKAESVKRDSALFQYIINTPNLFRCHLPYSKWTLGVALNVVWYYDELIITDPILDFIKNQLNDTEQQKQRLQNLLKFLLVLKESIVGGYILFAGDNIIPNKTGQFQAVSEELVNNPEVLDLFESYSILAQKPSPINNDIEDNLIQLLAKYEGMWGDNSCMGMYLPPHVMNSGKLANGINYDFTTPFLHISKRELIALGKQEMLDSLKKDYVNDISIVLETLTNSQRLNVPVLFYRDVDCVVSKQYALKNSNTSINMIANTSVYDCSLPYFEGIAPERLFDARTQIPDAFKEFRAFLYELVSKTMKATDNPSEIKFKIDSEVKSMHRKLEVEMTNAQRKWNFQGIAAPVAVGIGSLGLFSSGIDYSTLISTLLGTGGIVGTLKTWSDVSSEKKKAELNPVYFLWKVQQTKI